MLEIDRRASCWAVRRERKREKEKAEMCEFSLFLKLNLNLFSEIWIKVLFSPVFGFHSTSFLFFIFRAAKNPPLRPAE
jgi:hypothetical protein